MRKELLIYINTIDHNEEISVTSVAKNRAFVLINAGGNKFTANRNELLEALNAIDEFDKEHNTTVSRPILVDDNVQSVVPAIDEIEYGGEE